MAREIRTSLDGVNVGILNKVMSFRNCAKTPQVYTHVSTKNISAIRNPLDNLLAGSET